MLRRHEPGAPLRLAAERLGTASAATHRLLAAAPGSEILWRNDSDWTGVRLTASALSRYPNACPWRMSAADYRAAPTGIALNGNAIDTPWDDELATAMTERGRAVMEESLITELLADLASSY